MSTANITRSAQKNADVESCIRDQFTKLRFPEPKGGGIVIARLGLVFSTP